ncbi:hypothetical protein J437_LFUL014851 [Ladona fulva]|uniref:Uncharacterized protein n=1 Tax=Ladona fulva TaxID=123851 RepID=A0A8K0P4I0_LADFU|nr:hypothetical protein J437_LFUL014851 [Ladona fulva]
MWLLAFLQAENASERDQISWHGKQCRMQQISCVSYQKRLSSNAYGSGRTIQRTSISTWLNAANELPPLKPTSNTTGSVADTFSNFDESEIVISHMREFTRNRLGATLHAINEFSVQQRRPEEELLMF